MKGILFQVSHQTLIILEWQCHIRKVHCYSCLTTQTILSPRLIAADIHFLNISFLWKLVFSLTTYKLEPFSPSFHSIFYLYMLCESDFWSTQTNAYYLWDLLLNLCFCMRGVCLFFPIWHPMVFDLKSCMLLLLWLLSWRTVPGYALTCWSYSQHIYIPGISI